MFYSRMLSASVLVLFVLSACGTSQTTAKTSPTATTTPSAPVSAQALSLQEDFVAVVKSVTPSVVQIETTEGLGSGVVFDDKGDIVTNAHVVGIATSFQVTLANGKRHSASLVGKYDAGDIAVIHTDSTNLPPAQFADSAQLEVGDMVMALGNPLGLRSSVTSGIISALGRTVPEGNTVILPDVIQTSAPINPGNSGGALVDLNGQVVGIPTLAVVDQQLGGEAAGIGFAIPSDTVKSIAQQLIDHGRVINTGRAYLGVNVSAVVGGSGVLIVALEPNGPAAKAHLQAGDIIKAVNGQSTPLPAALTEILAMHKPGDLVTLDIEHEDGTAAKVSVALGELPGS